MSHHQYFVAGTASSASGDSLHFVRGGAVSKNRSKPGPKSTLVGKTPQQVQRRNERERRRGEQVNSGYEQLRLQVSPWEKLKNKKLTKSETLKAAIDYIDHLKALLGEGENRAPTTAVSIPSQMRCSERIPPSTASAGNVSLSSDSSSSSSPHCDAVPAFPYQHYSSGGQYSYLLPDPRPIYSQYAFEYPHFVDH